MTIQEAINAVQTGALISCTKDKYPALREALHKYAGDQINNGQDIYAQIALMEIKRLDKELS